MSIEALNVRWAWEKAGGTACVYMELRNTGQEPVALVSAASPDFRYANLVTTTDEENERVKAGLDRVTIEDTAVFAPGDNRVQFDAPARPLGPGDTVEVVLGFSDGSRIAVIAVAEAGPGVA